MERYKLTVIGANDQIYDEVEAEYLSKSTTTSGYYAFYIKEKLVACYPINRTIITRIEEVDNK
jgi:hypothetical protein